MTIGIKARILQQKTENIVASCSKRHVLSQQNVIRHERNEEVNDYRESGRTADSLKIIGIYLNRAIILFAHYLHARYVSCCNKRYIPNRKYRRW